MEVNSSNIEHIPVLARTLIEQINLPQDGVMVDATIGQGGHSLLFGKTLGPDGVIIALDVDKQAIRGAQFRLKDLLCKVLFICGNFSEIYEIVRAQEVSEVDFILADLGVCSSQLTDAEIGLSFQSSMALDMRIDKRLKRTAADIINKADEKFLADLLYKYGQERGSRRISRFIVRERQRRPITMTGQLASIVCRALGQPERKRRSRIHPATRTFQALRIAVNNELEYGWKPQGGVAFADGRFCQTLVKGEAAKPQETNHHREKWFCPYCGLDFREVDWSDVGDDSYCPNCTELRD